MKRLYIVISLVMVMGMVLSACATPTAETIIQTVEVPVVQTQVVKETQVVIETVEVAAPTEAVQPTEAPAPTPVPYVFGKIVGSPGGFLERALAGEFKGKIVVVDGTQTNPDDLKMAAGWQAFQDATGIIVHYVGDKQFEARISISVDAGQAPDIADFPQPGKVATFVSQGKIVDVSTFIPADWLTKQYNQSWLDMATMQSPTGPIMAGVWNRTSVKSLVWYPKAMFDAAGYKIPTTWDEMLALSDQIVADGDTPWCIGIESGAATGWPATDWMEDVMLRTTSPENYDKWVAGTLKFDSPEVKNAAEIIGNIWFKDGYVYGGKDGIVSTFFGTSPTGLFTDPPQCWLHRQANFITGFFPASAKPGVDFDFFYLPPIDPQYGKPVLTAGDIYVMFNDRPEVRALEEYFTLAQSVSGFLTQGGAFAVQTDAKPEMYAIPQDAAIAKVLADATTFRFDGSDLMPGEVGGGSFWKGMTDWVSGAADLDTVLKEIDASWPTK
ncbi:MAG: ABC transporter substrate-binding protein [Chloroflexi bacterium RBG_13_50_21]|nr:MAG: ABC transporter substrate-binding protein [Chloroflexi bacterium RBG_13_50_21]